MIHRISNLKKLFLACAVSLAPLQPALAYRQAPVDLTPTLAPTAFFAIEADSLAEIALIFGALTAYNIAQYLYQKRCMAQERAERIKKAARQEYTPEPEYCRA